METLIVEETEIHAQPKHEDRRLNRWSILAGVMFLLGFSLAFVGVIKLNEYRPDSSGVFWLSAGFSLLPFSVLVGSIGRIISELERIYNLNIRR